MIAFLAGEKIYLREIRPSDVSETSNYYRWLNDPEVTRYYQPYGIFPLSVETLLERVTGAIKNPDIVPLAIILPADGEEPVHIGAIQLGPINWLNRFAEIGYSVDRPYWGKGNQWGRVSLTYLGFPSLAVSSAGKNAVCARIHWHRPL